MVTAVATAHTTTRAGTAPPLPAPAAPARRPVPRARPIPVAAYPAGVPRWITFNGRRQRVVAVHEQPPLDRCLAVAPPGARRMEVELADGRVLTLLHYRGGWYERAG